MIDASGVLLPGPWRHEFVAAHGARFHVARAEPEGSDDAPLVVLLHGFPQFWWAWRHQLVSLVEAGFAVAAVDLRGSGASDKPPTGYDLPTLARDVGGVIRSLGARDAVVVGHGSGGAVAWSLAALHPQVVRALVSVSAPHPLRMRARGMRMLRGSARRLLLSAQLPWLPERRLARGDLAVRTMREWGAPGWLDDATAETYQSALRVPFAAHSAAERLRWPVRSLPRMDGRRFHAALRAAQDGPAVPTLQVYGTADGCLDVGVVARDLGRHRVAAGDVVYVPGAGHFVPEEAPGAFDEALLGWFARIGALPGAADAAGDRATAEEPAARVHSRGSRRGRVRLPRPARGR